VYCLEGHGRDVNEIDVPVHTSVEAEVAQVGRDAVEVARVIAEHGNRDAFNFLRLALCLDRWRKMLDGVGDVEDKLVIPADVPADEPFS